MELLTQTFLELNIPWNNIIISIQRKSIRNNFQLIPASEFLLHSMYIPWTKDHLHQRFVIIVSLHWIYHFENHVAPDAKCWFEIKYYSPVNWIKIRRWILVSDHWIPLWSAMFSEYFAFCTHRSLPMWNWNLWMANIQCN